MLGTDSGSALIFRFPPSGSPASTPSAQFELTEASTWSRLLSFAKAAPSADPVVAVLAFAAAGGAASGGTALLAAAV